ncbi:L-rhamnose mutarotase [Kushneria pakistanensis]|uniref:L-rhamnose mutarotase n=1 Tax=Kushneria pakistanensis TaxID=1508770 RepID=A0ABQ3FI63_9GAMM|nr:L-rhamnose mutarotase [Kushneria pakistanensis]GHC25115.1 L-rhamnose mutarotase [Kushneria pakistanensis]
MIVRAFRMTLNPGCEAEYKKRHDEIWPELTDALKDAGIQEYRIFLDPASHHLFAIMWLVDEHRVDALPQLPIMQRWWATMADLMVTHDNKAPVEIALGEMFSLTTGLPTTDSLTTGEAPCR